MADSIEEQLARMAQAEEERVPFDPQVESVRNLLADAVEHAAGSIKDQHDAADMELTARATSMLFGCWRSLQPDQMEPPRSGPIMQFTGPPAEVVEESKPEEAEEPGDGNA